MYNHKAFENNDKKEKLVACRRASKLSTECIQLFTASYKKLAFSKDLCKALMSANILKNKI